MRCLALPAITLDYEYLRCVRVYFPRESERVVADDSDMGAGIQVYAFLDGEF